MKIFRYPILVCLMLLSVLAFNNTVSASENPAVMIDGELKKLEPPAVINNDRTMVPVRFVVEDDALQGKVYWDGNLHKVAMDVRGKYMEFFIGSNYASVDGKKVFFDAKPYIYQDRTYVPLRFLVETLGATVSWDDKKREVNIEFDYRPDVFAYYYYTPRQELEDSIDLVSDIAFRWYKTNAYGHLSYEYTDDYASVLEYVRSKGVKTHASVVLMNTEELHTLLSNQQNRKMLIGNLLDAVKTNGYDGVNIDFEFISSKDAGYFSTFLSELKDYLGPLELSVAVFGRTKAEKWATGYEYEKIGQIADRVVVMAYDYHYRTGSPGPVAPLWWVENVAEYMTERMPADKVLMGMATYGYDWSSSGAAKTVTAAKLSSTISRYAVNEHFDAESMSPYFTYMDEAGNNHQIWMENKKSLSEKYKLVVSKKLGGISFWRIGNGFYDLYEVLENNRA